MSVFWMGSGEGGGDSPKHLAHKAVHLPSLTFLATCAPFVDLPLISLQLHPHLVVLLCRDYAQNYASRIYTENITFLCLVNQNRRHGLVPGQAMHCFLEFLESGYYLPYPVSLLGHKYPVINN